MGAPPDPMAWKIIQGDAREVLRDVAAETVQVCVTSPPYWNLRDYERLGQIGNERSLREYVIAIRATMRRVWDCLRSDGTLWLNLGDCYAGQGGGSNGTHPGLARHRESGRTRSKIGPKLKRKDLVGVPWRVAFALQEDGWYLRSSIIWHKANPMPQSVMDRPTSAHEYVFLLTKQPRYYFDAEALREPFADERMGNPGGREDQEAKYRDNPKSVQSPTWTAGAERGGRNGRDVWTLGSEPSDEKHFAPFPTEIPRRAILAGSKPGDLVLDPFAGSGTSGLVASQLGRSFLGVELNQDYVDLAYNRCCGPLFASAAAKEAL